MDVQAQLRNYQTKHNEIMAEMEAMMDAAATDGRTLDKDEEKAYDEKQKELERVQAHVKRLRVLVDDSDPPLEPVEPKKAPTIIARKHDPDDDFLGQSFVRRVIAKAVAHLEDYERSPLQVAKHRWPDRPMLLKVIESGYVTKAGVAGGGSGSGEWGAELVQADARYMGDFIQFLHDLTLYDQLPLREVPAHVTIKGQDGTGTAAWVGESLAIPASVKDFSSVTLTPLKVAAISVTSNELLKHSSPAAEMLVRDSMGKDCAERIDTTFVSATAASAGVSPAGMLNGLSALGSNGYDVAAVYADINELYAPFITAKHASGLIFCMNKARAKATGLLLNTLGVRVFPELGADGGSLAGDPVRTSDNVPATTVMLIDPANVYKIGDTGIEVSLSRDATIEQDGAPQGDSEGPTAASATLMSMFQTESTAFKVVRPINFAKRRATAAAFMDDAGWGDSTSATT